MRCRLAFLPFHVTAALALVLPIVFVASCAYQWGVFENDVEQIPFDRVEWRLAMAIEGHRTTRSQMIDDLLEEYDFHGWSRASILDLLGDPDWKAEDSGFLSDWDTAYLIGLERNGGFSLDDEYLVFRFNSDGTVVAYRTMVT
mgnify:CR=1 FL=1